ncbi:MAG: flagellar export chaperone FliS [Thermoguttaceae bacterium]|jgi:flagellar protein FliS|nr:flagellar export chaperone FliS [Thermoguttaceae bacterium]
MTASIRENYLVTEVLTATPQKLHLMLVEAAIRAGQQARQHWRSGDNEAASEALIRAQEIMSELVAGLNREVEPDLVRRVASVYLFIYRSLMEANFLRDESKLADALRVLEIERQTWRAVCEKLGNDQPVAPRADAAELQITAPKAPIPPPAVELPAAPDYAGGFSLDA